MRIANIITVVGIIQSLFLLALIIPNFKKSLSARYAIFLIVTLIVDLIAFLIFDLQLVSKYVVFIGFSTTIIFLYGPLIYLYIKSIDYKFDDKAFSSKDYLHFIPALIGLFIFSPFVLKQYTIPILSHLQTGSPKLFGLYNLAEILLDFMLHYLNVIIYLILSYRLLKRIEVKSNNHKLNHINPRQIKWLKYFLSIYLLIIGFVIIKFILNPFINFQIDSPEILNVFLVLNVFVITYIAFKNQTVLEDSMRHFVKYKKSNLSGQFKNEYIHKLLSFFENESPFLEKDLTLNKVAESLNVSRNHLSQILNDDLGKGFNEFVNDYRIRLAEIYIIAPEKSNLTIEAIANEVGFKSKSSFNSAFKKKLGITPSDFKKKNKAISFS